MFSLPLVYDFLNLVILFDSKMRRIWGEIVRVAGCMQVTYVHKIYYRTSLDCIISSYSIAFCNKSYTMFVEEQTVCTRSITQLKQTVCSSTRKKLAATELGKGKLYKIQFNV